MPGEGVVPTVICSDSSVGVNISLQQLCDGSEDCPSGSDENKTLCSGINLYILLQYDIHKCVELNFSVTGN